MRSIVIFLLLFCVDAFAGGFRFPNVDYSYTKLHFYNIYWDEEGLPDHHIYANGVYAASKLGDGMTIKQPTLDQIHNIFSRGVDELRMGLSKCFIPRHGIIYYDKNHKPVASLSICFECERIALWSKNEIPKSHKDPGDFDIDYAEEQMKKLKDLFLDANILVSKHQETYQTVLESDKAFECEGSITFTRPDYDSLYHHLYTADDVKKWQLPDARISLKEDVNIEISAGGEEYHFKQLTNRENTVFDFSSNDENAFLVHAEIRDPSIRIPTGISVGMSLEQLQTNIGIWDGIDNPSSVIVKGEKIKIIYLIKNRTVTSIELQVDRF